MNILPFSKVKKTKKLENSIDDMKFPSKIQSEMSEYLRTLKDQYITTAPEFLFIIPITTETLVFILLKLKLNKINDL